MMVPIVLFLVIGAVILVPQILRSRDRQRMYEVMRTAYERGQPVPPDFVDAMTRRRREEPIDYTAFEPAPDSVAAPGLSRDLRRGIVWLAVGLGLVVVGGVCYAGFYSDGGAPETFSAFAAMGAIPTCVGLAYLGLWYFTRVKPT